MGRKSPETVRILRVFVSSPGDVEEERAVMDEIVALINRTDGTDNGYRLDLFLWENDVIPRIGSKPQAVVDEQTKDYEVYLGIMSARFGGGGTTKEFHDALKNYKTNKTPWITFYFNDNPKLSSKPSDVKQYLKVCEFREKLKSMGIVSGYNGVRGNKHGFYEQVSEHLHKIVKELLKLTTGSEKNRLAKKSRSAKAKKSGPIKKKSDSSKKKDTIPPDYLQALKRQCENIDLLGLKVQHGQVVRLNHVYVPLAMVGEREDLRSRMKEEESLFRKREEERPVQLLLDLLDKEALYIAGPPGSGKTTFCRWVVCLACEGRMPQIHLPSPKRYVEFFPECFRNRLPMLVRLRDFWHELPHTPDCWDMAPVELEDSLCAWADRKKLGGLSGNLIRLHLEKGSLLLVLDGVDEVPLTHEDIQHDPRHSFQPRAMLLAALSAALPTWTGQGNRVLLTSRPYGISAQAEDRLGIRVVRLGNLDPAQRELLVRRWFHCLIEQPGAAKTKAEQMLAHVAQRHDIEPLTANPMLLTSMCILYQQGGRLPQDRYELYDRIIDNVLFNRFEEDRQVVDPVRNRLSVVAYGMHTGEGLGEERKTPQAEATYAEIDRMIQRYQDKASWTEPSFRGAVDAREQLLGRTGILLPRDEQQAGFYHLTFQDFLAAQRLLDIHGDELYEVYHQRATTPEWRSTLQFVFGSQLAKHSSSERSTVLLGRLIESLNDDTVGLAVVLSDCLHMLLKRGVRLKDDLEKRFREYCLAAIIREVALPHRIDLADTLSHLGDPRLDATRSEYWAEIPASTFWMGAQKSNPKQRNYDREAYSDESPVHQVRLDTYCIAKYPVTVKQYKEFMDDEGYKKRAHWKSGGFEDFPEPEGWAIQMEYPSRPVVGVSWFEASAYCNWSGYRLPTEAEWELAARGTEGRRYPWGEEDADERRLNFEENIGHLTPMGIYPKGATPEGVHDLAGNMWEWCGDWFGKYSDKQVANLRGPKGEASLRVIRGGGWDDPAWFCRAASRTWIGPELRRDFLGFRVAAVPSGRQDKQE